MDSNSIAEILNLVIQKLSPPNPINHYPIRRFAGDLGELVFATICAQHLSPYSDDGWYHWGNHFEQKYGVGNVIHKAWIGWHNKTESYWSVRANFKWGNSLLFSISRAKNRGKETVREIEFLLLQARNLFVKERIFNTQSANTYRALCSQWFGENIPVEFYL